MTNYNLSMQKEYKNQHYYYGVMCELLCVVVMFFKGYRFITRRFKHKTGEIDVVFKKGEMIVFMEVKARKNENIDYYNIVSNAQLKRIFNASNYFLLKNKKYLNYQKRFDLMIFKFFRPIHIQNISYDVRF